MPTNTATQRITLDHSLLNLCGSPRRWSMQGYKSPMKAAEENRQMFYTWQCKMESHVTFTPQSAGLGINTDQHPSTPCEDQAGRVSRFFWSILRAPCSGSGMVLFPLSLLGPWDYSAAAWSLTSSDITNEASMCSQQAAVLWGEEHLRQQGLLGGSTPSHRQDDTCESAVCFLYVTVTGNHVFKLLQSIWIQDVIINHPDQADVEMLDWG